MLGYLVHRILIMIPTLIAISLVIFIIIHLPPGDYFSTYIAELQSQGEKANLAKIAFLKAQYGFDRPLWEQYLYWVGGLIQGDMGYSFLYDLPVNKVVGDRLFLTFLVSFVTILFTYIVAFPIGVFSATHQYSIADYVLTFIGFLGLATPSFLLALLLLYFAHVYFGISVGGLMDPHYLDAPWSWGKAISVFAHIWIPVVVNDHLRNVPSDGVYNWDPGAHFGMYRPDGFWFDNTESPSASAGNRSATPAASASLSGR